MAEKLSPKSPEQQSQNVETSKEAAENLKALQEKAKNTAEASDQEVKELGQKAGEHAVSGKEHAAGESAPTSTPNVSVTAGLHKDLKDNQYKKTLKNVQSKLSKRDRAASKIIHQPAVEKISDVAAKTVARPYALLLAGLSTLLVSSYVLFAANRYGFEYNYSIFIIAFMGGFGLGLFVELLIWFKNRS